MYVMAIGMLILLLWLNSPETVTICDCAVALGCTHLQGVWDLSSSFAHPHQGAGGKTRELLRMIFPSISVDSG